MSVETSYFIVDWATLQGMAPDADLVEHFILGPNGDSSADADDDFSDDEEFEDAGGGTREWHAEGARALEFGDYDYYFQSWGFSTEVSDWLRPLRSQFDERVCGPFVELFSDMGVLFEDDYGPHAVKSGVQFSDSSLIATLSPADVAKLLAVAQSIDREAVVKEFGRVLAAHACRGLPSGEAVAEWLDALDRALAGVTKGEGILILAPA